MSSKEQMRSPVRVQVQDEITPKGVKDRSVTMEHSRGLERPNFMREDLTSWTQGWRCQNNAIKGVQIQNDKRTHVEEGATEPDRSGPVPVGPSRSAHLFLVSVRLPISWAWRWCNPKGHPQGREVGWERDHSRGGSIESKDATTSGGGRQGLASTPPEEEEDTIGSVTMINGSMLSALMG
jgi:hypothetical protein